jgi:predicted GNAT family acetyltransferase
VTTELELADAPARSRYEARLEGELVAFLDYRRRVGRLTLIHTEVLPAREGGGIGSRLVRHVLDDARARGERLVVACPFVRAYLARHPADLDLVISGGPRPAAGP